VGNSIDRPGAARARLIFARARINYPASPAIADHSDYWLGTVARPLSAINAKPPAITLLPGAY
jgi:D-alanyl-D-alanine carboxypeptidase